MGDYRRVIIWSVCLWLVFVGGQSAVAHGQTPPWLPDVEEDMGRSAKEQLVELYGGEGRLLLHEYLWVEEIFQRVVQAIGPTKYTYDLTILNSYEANAFALPGGYIFLTKGILRLIGQDEHQVASVIGHE